jgi:hypothetical protein
MNTTRSNIKEEKNYKYQLLFLKVGVQNINTITSIFVAFDGSVVVTKKKLRIKQSFHTGS